MIVETASLQGPEIRSNVSIAGMGLVSLIFATLHGMAKRGNMFMVKEIGEMKRREKLLKTSEIDKLYKINQGIIQSGINHPFRTCLRVALTGEEKDKCEYFDKDDHDIECEECLCELLNEESE